MSTTQLSYWMSEKGTSRGSILDFFYTITSPKKLCCQATQKFCTHISMLYTYFLVTVQFFSYSSFLCLCQILAFNVFHSFSLKFIHIFVNTPQPVLLKIGYTLELLRELKKNFHCLVSPSQAN